MTWLLLLPLGAGAGFVAGLLGIGGGVLLVPLFLEFFRAHGYPPLSVQTAMGTSKAVVLVSAAFAAREQARADRVDWGVVLALAPWVVVGAVAGGIAAAWTSPAVLQVAFGVFLAVVGAWMARGRDQPPPRSGLPAGLRAGGVGVGALASFFGVGGGILAVPLLHRSFGKPIHDAAATSSGLMLFTASAGVATHLWAGWIQQNPVPGTVGFVHVGAWALGGLGALVGARRGVRVAGRVSPVFLRRLFSGVLLAVSARLLLSG